MLNCNQEVCPDKETQFLFLSLDAHGPCGFQCVCFIIAVITFHFYVLGEILNKEQNESPEIRQFKKQFHHIPEMIP